MVKRITLSCRDEKLLIDVLDYLLSDDKEKDDFNKQHSELYDLWNEYDVLEVNRVPYDHDARTHIYFKVETLRQSLVECQHG